MIKSLQKLLASFIFLYSLTQIIAPTLSTPASTKKNMHHILNMVSKFSDEDKLMILKLAKKFNQKHNQNIKKNVKLIIGDSFYNKLPERVIIATQLGHLETTKEIAKKLILLGIQIRNIKKLDKLSESDQKKVASLTTKDIHQIETHCYYAAFVHYMKFLTDNDDKLKISEKISTNLSMIVALKYAMFSAHTNKEKIQYKTLALKSIENLMLNLQFYEHKYISHLFIIHLGNIEQISRDISRKRINNLSNIIDEVNDLKEDIIQYEI